MRARSATWSSPGAGPSSDAASDPSGADPSGKPRRNSWFSWGKPAAAEEPAAAAADANSASVAEGEAAARPSRKVADIPSPQMRRRAVSAASCGSPARSAASPVRASSVSDAEAKPPASAGAPSPARERKGSWFGWGDGSPSPPRQPTIAEVEAEEAAALAKEEELRLQLTQRSRTTQRSNSPRRKESPACNSARDSARSSGSLRATYREGNHQRAFPGSFHSPSPAAPGTVNTLPRKPDTRPPPSATPRLPINSTGMCSGSLASASAEPVLREKKQYPKSPGRRDASPGRKEPSGFSPGRAASEAEHQLRLAQSARSAASSVRSGGLARGGSSARGASPTRGSETDRTEGGSRKSYTSSSGIHLTNTDFHRWQQSDYNQKQAQLHRDEKEIRRRFREAQKRQHALRGRAITEQFKLEERQNALDQEQRRQETAKEVERIQNNSQHLRDRKANDCALWHEHGYHLTQKYANRNTSLVAIKALEDRKAAEALAYRERMSREQADHREREAFALSQRQSKADQIKAETSAKVIIGAKVFFAKQRWHKADVVREDVRGMKEEIAQQKIDHLEAAAVKKVVLGSSAPEARARKAKAHEERMEQVRLQREQLAATNQAFRDQKDELVERRRQQHDVIHRSKFVPEECVVSEIHTAGTPDVFRHFFRFFKPWLQGPHEVPKEEWPEDGAIVQRL